MYFVLLLVSISSLHAYNDLGFLRGPSVKISKWSGPYFNEEDQKKAFESLMHQNVKNVHKRHHSKMDIDPNKLFNTELIEKPRKRQKLNEPEGQIYFGEVSASSPEDSLSPPERLANLVSKPIFEENESDGGSHSEEKEEEGSRRSEAEERRVDEKEKESERRVEEHREEDGKKRAVPWHKVNFLRRRHKTRDLMAERRSKLYREIKHYIKKSKIAKHSITKRNKKERHHRTKISKPQKKTKITKTKTRHKRILISKKTSNDTVRTVRNEVSPAYNGLVPGSTGEDFGTQFSEPYYSSNNNGFSIGSDLPDKHDNSLVEEIQSNIKPFHSATQRTGDTRGFDDFVSDDKTYGAYPFWNFNQNAFSPHGLEEHHGQVHASRLTPASEAHRLMTFLKHDLHKLGLGKFDGHKNGIGLPFHGGGEMDINLHNPHHVSFDDDHFDDYSHPNDGAFQHHQGERNHDHGYFVDDPHAGDYFEDYLAGEPHHSDHHDVGGLHGGDDFEPVLEHIHKTEGNHHELSSPTVTLHDNGVSRLPLVTQRPEMTVEQYGKHLDNVMSHYAPVEKLTPLGSHKSGHYFDTKQAPIVGPVEIGAPVAVGSHAPASAAAAVGSHAPASAAAAVGKHAPASAAAAVGSHAPASAAAAVGSHAPASAAAAVGKHAPASDAAASGAEMVAHHVVKDASKVQHKSEKPKIESKKEGQLLQNLRNEVKQLKNELLDLRNSGKKKTIRPHLDEKSSSANKDLAFHHYDNHLDDIPLDHLPEYQYEDDGIEGDDLGSHHGHHGDILDHHHHLPSLFSPHPSTSHHMPGFMVHHGSHHDAPHHSYFAHDRPPVQELPHHDEAVHYEEDLHLAPLKIVAHRVDPYDHHEHSICVECINDQEKEKEEEEVDDIEEHSEEKLPKIGPEINAAPTHSAYQVSISGGPVPQPAKLVPVPAPVTIVTDSCVSPPIAAKVSDPCINTPVPVRKPAFRPMVSVPVSTKPIASAIPAKVASKPPAAVVPAVTPNVAQTVKIANKVNGNVPIAINSGVTKATKLAGETVKVGQEKVNEASKFVNKVESAANKFVNKAKPEDLAKVTGVMKVVKTSQEKLQEAANDVQNANALINKNGGANGLSQTTANIAAQTVNSGQQKAVDAVKSVQGANVAINTLYKTSQPGDLSKVSSFAKVVRTGQDKILEAANDVQNSQSLLKNFLGAANKPIADTSTKVSESINACKGDQNENRCQTRQPEEASGVSSAQFKKVIAAFEALNATIPAALQIAELKAEVREMKDQMARQSHPEPNFVSKNLPVEDKNSKSPFADVQTFKNMSKSSTSSLVDVSIPKNVYKSSPVEVQISKGSSAEAKAPKYFFKGPPVEVQGVVKDTGPDVEVADTPNGAAEVTKLIKKLGNFAVHADPVYAHRYQHLQQLNLHQQHYLKDMLEKTAEVFNQKNKKVIKPDKEQYTVEEILNLGHETDPGVQQAQLVSILRKMQRQAGIATANYWRRLQNRHPFAQPNANTWFIKNEAEEDQDEDSNSNAKSELLQYTATSKPSKEHDSKLSSKISYEKKSTKAEKKEKGHSHDVYADLGSSVPGAESILRTRKSFVKALLKNVGK